MKNTLFPYRLLVSACLFASMNVSAILPRSRAASPADPAATETILTQLEEGMRPINAIYSEFKLERSLQMFAAPIISEGVLVFEKPRRIRWETTKPYHSLFVADKSNASQFEWIDAKRKPLQTPMPPSLFQMLDQIAALHEGRLREAGSAFEISVASGEVCRIVLAPRRAKDRAFLKAMELHFSPDISKTLAIILREANGDTTTISIQREKRNPALPDNVFDINDPADIENIRRRVFPNLD